MLFNSWSFFVLAAIVFTLYYQLKTVRSQNILLLISSYAFYAAWDWRFLSLLFFSTFLDYYCSRGIAASGDTRRRKLLLMMSVVGNLGILCTFKYFDFFVDNMEVLFGSFGFAAENWRLNVILPIGISFYTIQTLGYTIDVYRGKAKPEHSMLDFALFVAFFPQLIAGPIERASSLIPQLVNPRVLHQDQIFSGAWLILLGLFKKCVIADNLDLVVGKTFGGPEMPSGLICLLTMYAFVFQTYADFSGYSDMARGMAKLLGIDLVLNFNLPLFSSDPVDFWNRWHISLSNWVRDYLFYALGGGVRGGFKTYRNFFLVFFLIGAWHGAAWIYVVWGLYNALVFVVYYWAVLNKYIKSPKTRARRIVYGIIMFHITAAGFIVHPCLTISRTLQFHYKILTDWAFDPLSAETMFYVLAFVGGLLAVELYVRNADDPRGAPGWRKGIGYVVVGAMILSLVLLAAPTGKPFIYFQF